MNKYYPRMYKKNIQEIPYEKLKKIGIKCLVFDLDNTIALIDQEDVNKETLNLFEKLKKEFIVVIISNNYKKRVMPYSNKLGVDYVSFAMKPSTRGLKKISKKYKLKPVEMAMIGDQIMTDIKSGNVFGSSSILVDPLGIKDLKITSFNRYLENKVIKKFNEKKLLMKGNYYE
ncbi:MAG: YqeG family HAD IIIA-type phosphatase [Bacilli bacterium]|nr:YqeG family HAD IIIA-type phosphatase [Bacilli bacterium]